MESKMEYGSMSRIGISKKNCDRYSMWDHGQNGTYENQDETRDLNLNKKWGHQPSDGLKLYNLYTKVLISFKSE